MVVLLLGEDMLEVEVEDAKFWKRCVDAIVNLIDEGVFEFTSDGVSLRAMDPSRIAMVSFSIPKSSFSKYNVDAPAKIGLRLDNLSKILARTRGNEKLRMSLEENRFVLEFISDSKRNFRLPLVELPEGYKKEPKKEYTAEIKIDGTKFKDILKDASLVSSYILLEAWENGFIITAHGDSAELKVENDKSTMDGFNLKERAHAKFPLQYLSDMVEACPPNSKITIYLKSKAPVILNYQINGADITYYLAPRIEE